MLQRENSRQLKIAVVGLGAMGRNHVRVLNGLDDVSIVALVDHQRDLPSPVPGLRVFKDLTALETVSLDGAVIATPTSTHHEVASFFLRKKIPVLVEKPIAQSSKLAVDLVDLAAEMGTWGMVGQLERFNPAIIALKNEVLAGRVGSLVQLMSTRIGPRPSRISDVGVALDLAIHDLDLARFISDSEFKRVNAESVSVVSGGREDSILITGRLENEVIVNHVVNWLSPEKRREFSAQGERGILTANTVDSTLTLQMFASHQTPDAQLDNAMQASERVNYELTPREPLETEIRSFLDAIRGLSLPAVTLKDGLQSLRIVESALSVSASM